MGSKRSVCLHNGRVTTETVKVGKEKIVYMKCHDCNATLPL